MSERKEIKKKRGDNYTTFETQVLTNLITKYSSVINNKKSDAVSWKEKLKIWEKLRDDFVAETGQIRTVQNLKHKFENLKKKKKKKLALHKREMYKTGGGPHTPYSQTFSAVEDKIIGLLGNTAEGLTNPFDSDYILCTENENTPDLTPHLPTRTQENLTIEPTLQDWSQWNPSLLKTPRNEKLIRAIKSASSFEKNQDLNLDQPAQIIEVAEVLCSAGTVDERGVDDLPPEVDQQIFISAPGPSCDRVAVADFEEDSPEPAKKMKKIIKNNNNTNIINKKVLHEQREFWVAQKKAVELKSQLALERQQWEMERHQRESERHQREMERHQREMERHQRESERHQQESERHQREMELIDLNKEKLALEIKKLKNE